MWYFQSTVDDSKKFVILPNKDYVIGRRDCDIIIDNDQSVSRKHALLRVSHPEANVANINKPAVLCLKDVSTYGTFVNNQKVQKEKVLQSGDEVRFGAPKSVYRAVYDPFIVCTSLLDGSGKKAVRALLTQIGGHVSNDWRKDSSFLVMKSVTVTIKVVCALVSQKPVVTVKYLHDLVGHLKGEIVENPQPQNYLPPVTEKLMKPNVSFHEDASRASIFLGMTFYFLNKKQFEKMNLAIELGGGVPILTDSPKNAELEAFLEDRTVVMNPAAGEISIKEQKQWVEKVKTFLQRRGKYMVQDAEIGYAVLYCSTEDFCNPDKDVSHLLSASMQFTQSLNINSQLTAIHSQNFSAPKTMAPVSDTARGVLVPASPSHTATGEDSKQRVAETPDLKSDQDGNGFGEKEHKVFAVPESLTEDTPKVKREKKGNVDSSQSHVEADTRISSAIPESVDSKPLSEKVEDEMISTNMQSIASEALSPTYSDKPVAVKIKKEIAENSISLLDEEEEDVGQKRKPPPTRNKRRLRVSDDDSEEDPFDFIPKRPRKTTVAIKSQQNSDSEDADLFDSDTHSSKVPSRGKAKKSPAPAQASEFEEVSTPGRPAQRPKSKAGRTSVSEVPTEESSASPAKSRSAGPVQSIPTHSGDTHGVSKPVPKGFLSTRIPITEQVAVNPKFEKENIEASAVVVEFGDLIVPRSRPRRVTEDQSGVSGNTMRWKGKLVPNFKKFKKTMHSGADSLPRIIGGRDLEEHCRSANTMMDICQRDLLEMESQQQARDKEAQELFDWQPPTRGKKGRR